MRQPCQNSAQLPYTAYTLLYNITQTAHRQPTKANATEIGTRQDKS